MSIATVPITPDLGIRREIFEIHRSEMSTVFYAEDRERELVVVKALHPDADDFLRESFAVEAKILAALEHPQIPEIIEDNTDLPQPSFKMEPVSSNRDHTRHIGRLLHEPDPDFAAEVIRSALVPLAHMHSEGFIHRDFKPSNLILGLSGVVTLADFGAARPRPYNHKIESGEMVEGSPEHIAERDRMLAFSVRRAIAAGKRIIGTLQYLSPEEVRDEAPDATSDIYSVGTSLYELLYGRLAHSGPVTPMPPEEAQHSNREAIEDSIVEAVISAAQVKLKTVPEGRAEEEIDLSIPPDRPVPGGLVRIVEKATRPLPNERYQTADEMTEDLSRYLRDKS